MARTLEDIVKEQFGGMVFANASLLAQLEKTQEELAALKEFMNQKASPKEKEEK